MIWGVHTTLGSGMWYVKDRFMQFEEEAWNELVKNAYENGINTIEFDLGEGIQYASHPELAKPGSWTREHVREEVGRLKNMGITIIPRLNFSAFHDYWLGEYAYMLSTPTYYRVCRDLITEVYDLFDKPPYIHLGMDEEGNAEIITSWPDMELVSYRRGELFWHDLRYLCDCVVDTGAKPWICSDVATKNIEEFKKRFKPGSIVLSPWWYYGIRKEHWSLIDSNQRYIENFREEPCYSSMNLTYVEEIPRFKEVTDNAISLAKEGYELIPKVSIWGENEHNADDVVEYFLNEAPKESLLGFVTAAWKFPMNKDSEYIKKDMLAFTNARKKFAE